MLYIPFTKYHEAAMRNREAEGAYFRQKNQISQLEAIFQILRLSITRPDGIIVLEYNIISEIQLQSILSDGRAGLVHGKSYCNELVRQPSPSSSRNS
jgi:hypothetical protein